MFPSLRTRSLRFSRPPTGGKVTSRETPEARVVVLGLVPRVVAWNREFLKDLNGALLQNPRVQVIEGDAVPYVADL